MAERARGVGVRWAGSVLALLMLFGCGEEEPADVPVSTTPSVATTETTSDTGGQPTSTAPTTFASTTPTTVVDEQSPLKGKDIPPEGIRGQFEFFQEGDGSCRGLPAGPPRALVEREQIEIGQFFAICFPGFPLHQSVAAEVRLPDGTVRRSQMTDIDPDGVANWFWSTLPGDPLGVYAVTATRGSLTGTGAFTVLPASRPGILIPLPHAAPAGSTFQIGIFGFEPNATVPLYVYRKVGRPYEFVTVLSVKVDAQGQTLYQLQTDTDDPPGEYCFVHRGLKASPNYACGGLSTMLVQ